MVLAPRASFFGPSMKYWKCPRVIVGEDCKQPKLNAAISTEVSCWATGTPLKVERNLTFSRFPIVRFEVMTYALDGMIDSEGWLMLSALAHRAVESQVIRFCKGTNSGRPDSTRSWHSTSSRRLVRILPSIYVPSTSRPQKRVGFLSSTN